MKLWKKCLLPGCLLVVAILTGGPGFSDDASGPIAGEKKVIETPGPAVGKMSEAGSESTAGGNPQELKRNLPADPKNPADTPAAEQSRKDAGTQAGAERTDTPPALDVDGEAEKEDVPWSVQSPDNPEGEPNEPMSGQTADSRCSAAITPEEAFFPKSLSAPETAEPATGGQTGSQNTLKIEPLYVRALNEIVAGHNDSNPAWSPSGKMLAFERSTGDRREIIISQPNGSVVKKIYYRLSGNDADMEFFFPGIVEDISYNSGIAWSPDESKLVFMSNGGSGNYDLYLLPVLGNEKTIRLTEDAEKDSHPHWNPAGDQLVFVSGRSGKAEIFIMDLKSRAVFNLTKGKKTYLYPQWSPDGKKIVMIYGSNENHDIYLVEDIAGPVAALKALTEWEYDDLRPVWSPDGKKIAFYSNYNPENNPKVWSIIVIAADGSAPAKGQGLAEKIVAQNVIPDIEVGPAWMPDSQRIVYVKNDERAYNPIYVVNIVEKTDLTLKTETKMNHDVVCSTDGTLAFRAQTEQWDHIYIARLKE